MGRCSGREDRRDSLSLSWPNNFVDPFLTDCLSVRSRDFGLRIRCLQLLYVTYFLTEAFGSLESRNMGWCSRTTMFTVSCENITMVNELTEPTLWISTTIAAREPGFRVSGGMRLSYSDVPYSWTLPTVDTKIQRYLISSFAAKAESVPVPQSLTILGGPSNAINMTVMRPFSLKWEIVSFPTSPMLFMHNMTQLPLYGEQHTAASKIFIPDFILVYQMKAVIRSLRRAVDVASRNERSCSHPKDMLFRNPFHYVLWNAVIKNDHVFVF